MPDHSVVSPKRGAGAGMGVGMMRGRAMFWFLGLLVCWSLDLVSTFLGSKVDWFLDF